MARPASPRTTRAVMSDSEIVLVRENLRRRADSESTRLQERLAEARKDADAIIAHVAERYRPCRIYQWGSLVTGEHFGDYSDIDVAVEGLTGPEQYFAILADAEAMTRFPIDIVEMERIDPRYADRIRARGVLRYERATRPSC